MGTVNPAQPSPATGAKRSGKKCFFKHIDTAPAFGRIRRDLRRRRSGGSGRLRSRPAGGQQKHRGKKQVYNRFFILPLCNICSKLYHIAFGNSIRSFKKTAGKQSPHRLPKAKKRASAAERTKAQNFIYISRRPSSALARVTSSIYSKSPPMGIPWAIRVVRMPIGFKRRAI